MIKNQIKLDISEVHSINLDLLKEFDRFCKKHNIKYRLEAGTLIGAMRHKGFIPWDDDADVAIKRSEFNKLLEALKTDSFSDGYVFKRCSDYKDNEHFSDFMDRLYYTKKVYREGEKYISRFDGMRQYLWLDLIIIDNIKYNFLIYFLYKVVYALSMGHRYKGENKKGNIIEKLIVLIVGAIGRLIPMKILYSLQEKICTLFLHEDTETCFFSSYPMPWIGYETNSKDEDDIIYTDFEDASLPIIRKSHDLLNYLYGDYTVLPPIEERVPSHEI